MSGEGEGVKVVHEDMTATLLRGEKRVSGEGEGTSAYTTFTPSPDKMTPRDVLDSFFGSRAFTGKDARAVLRVHGYHVEMHTLEAVGIVERSGSTGRRWRLT